MGQTNVGGTAVNERRRSSSEGSGPFFLTQWEREDHERRQRGEPELGPLGKCSGSNLADGAHDKAVSAKLVYPDQTLVARIKRSSKYRDQSPPNQWFEVRIVADNYYQLRGNSNNYRFVDVAMGIRFADGTIVDFTSGKKIQPAAESR